MRCGFAKRKGVSSSVYPGTGAELRSGRSISRHRAVSRSEKVGRRSAAVVTTVGFVVVLIVVMLAGGEVK